MNFLFYRKFESASKEEDNYWLSEDKSKLRKPDYQYVMKLEESAWNFFLEEIAPKIDNPELYLANQMISAVDDRNFVKMKFIINIYEKKSIDNLDKLLFSFSYIFYFFIKNYPENNYKVRSHFYILERLLDLLLDYPHEYFIQLILNLKNLEYDKEYLGVQTCIIKGLALLVEIGSGKAIFAVKTFAKHFDIEVREEVENILEIFDE